MEGIEAIGGGGAAREARPHGGSRRGSGYDGRGGGGRGGTSYRGRQGCEKQGRERLELLSRATLASIVYLPF